MATLSFAALEGNALPAHWQAVGGAWQLKPLTRPERNRSAIAAVASDRHVAFPGICKTRSGQLIAVYREGYTHASGNRDDGKVMLVRSTDKGKTWGEPGLLYDGPTMDDRNAGIACMADGTLVCVFDKWVKDASGVRQHHWAWLTQSADEGRTWSEPVKVSKGEDVHTRSRPLDLGDGTWLIPYAESTAKPTTAAYFSIFDPTAGEFEEILATPLGQRNIGDEVAVIRAPDGHLVALIRSGVDPALWQITSHDNGRTWGDGHWSSIPSQFTPCDLITLANGWLLCSFSFRERRNERLVVSRDGGATWDVENSVDVFDGTLEVGGDRSYIASVQLDADTIGSVLYETQEPPAGGHIWFVTTPIAAFDAPRQPALYQADTEAEAAFALWPSDAVGGEAADFAYRFTGRFGSPPNVVGLLLDYQDEANYAAFEFHMGVGRDMERSRTNHVQFVRCTDGQCEVSGAQDATGDWFNDGNIHRLGARREGEAWVMTLDDSDQIAAPASVGSPCGILVRRAAVAVHDLSWSD